MNKQELLEYFKDICKELFVIANYLADCEDYNSEYRLDKTHDILYLHDELQKIRVELMMKGVNNE